jgi:hypothetical protein
MRVFINEQAFDAAEGSTVLAAVRRFDPALAGRVEAGSAYLTDGRAIRLSGSEQLSAGDILRVVVASKRAGGRPDADA